MSDSFGGNHDSVALIHSGVIFDFGSGFFGCILILILMVVIVMIWMMMITSQSPMNNRSVPGMPLVPAPLFKRSE